MDARTASKRQGRMRRTAAVLLIGVLAGCAGDAPSTEDEPRGVVQQSSPTATTELAPSASAEPTPSPEEEAQAAKRAEARRIARQRVARERRGRARQERAERERAERERKEALAAREAKAAQAPADDCDPNYEGACLDPNAEDYDCEGGSGDGPKYTGTVQVAGEDPFDLDRDGDGVACDTSG